MGWKNVNEPPPLHHLKLTPLPWPHSPSPSPKQFSPKICRVTRSSKLAPSLQTSTFPWNYHIPANMKLLCGTNSSGPEVIKLLSCLTKLSMKFSLLINMIMPTIVGIFIFISREISWSAMFSKKEFAIISNLRFISWTNFMLSWVEHEKIYNFGPDYQLMYLKTAGHVCVDPGQMFFEEWSGYSLFAHAYQPKKIGYIW